MEVLITPKKEPGTKDAPIDFESSADDGESDLTPGPFGSDSDGDFDLEDGQDVQAEGTHQKVTRKSEGKRTTSTTSTWSSRYRQPDVTGTIPDIKKHAQWQENHDTIVDKMKASLSESCRKCYRGYIHNISDANVLWGSVKTDQTASKDNRCAPCAEAGFDCVVKIEPTGDDQLGRYAVIGSEVHELNRARGGCDIVLKSTKQGSATEPITRKRKRKPSPVKRHARQDARPRRPASHPAARDDKIGAAGPSTPRDSRPFPARGTAAKFTTLPSSDSNPQTIDTSASSAVVSGEPLQATSPTQATKAEISTALINIEGFTKAMKEIRSQGGGLKWGEQVMFEMVEQPIGVLRKAVQSAGPDGRTGWKKEIAEAVDEVGEFAQQLRSEIFDKVPEGETVPYMIKSMFKKVDGEIADLKKVLQSA